MTPRAALLGHEAVCPDCEDGRIPVVTECSSSRSEEPYLYTGRFQACPRCDGTGVVLNERRSVERDSGSTLVNAFRQLRVDLDLANAVAVHQADHIDQLIRENRAIRTVMHDQARLLDRAEFKHIPKGGDAHAHLDSVGHHARGGGR